MIRPFIHIFSFVLLLSGSAAIPAVLQAQQVPASLQQRLQGKTKLPAIMGEVETFYQAETPRRPADEKKDFESSAYQKWKRWEWYMRPRLDSNGDFFDYARLKQQEMERYDRSAAARTLATGAVWSFLGPHTMTYQGGSFRGLGRVDCIAFHPTNPFIFFVGTPAGGVWKTSTGGASWENISFNLPNTSVSSIAVSPQNPDIIYIATGDNRGGSFTGRYNRSTVGIYKTTDGGFHWNPVNAAATTGFGNAYTLLIHPNNSNILLLATQNGIYRTTDGGLTWNNSLSGTAYDVCFKPGNPNRVYAITASGVRYSTNNGSFFFAGNLLPAPAAGWPRARLAVSPQAPANVYLLLGSMITTGPPNALMKNQYNGLYISSDSGVNYNRIHNTPNVYSDQVNGIGAGDEQDQSNYDLALAIRPNNAQRIAAGGKCVWRSTNGGSSFSSATDYAEIGGQMDRYIHPDIQDLAYNPLNNILYAATDGGVYRSNDDGATWSDLSDGIHTTMFYKLAGTEQNSLLLVGGTQDNGIKYRNTPTSDFDHIIGGDGFDAVVDPTNASKIVASGNRNIYFITNGVLTSVNNPDSGKGSYPKLAHHPTISGSVYAAYPNGMWRYVPFPVAGWTYLDSTFLRGCVALATCPSNNNRVYFINSNRIFRSDNNGSTWTVNLATAAAGFSNNPVLTDIYVNPLDASVVYVTNSNGTNGQKVYYSTDAGATWTNISGTLPNVAINCVAVDNNNNSYVGTDLGVFYQPNYSNEWIPYYNGLPKAIVSDLVINHNAGLLTAATYGHGVWQTTMFTACNAFDTLRGSYTGERFYSAGNTLAANAQVYGGDGSRMHLRAGNEIVLTDSFIVYQTSNMDAVIAPCDAGPVPAREQSPYYKAPSGQLSPLKQNP